MARTETSTADDGLTLDESDRWARFFRATGWLLMNALLVSAVMSQGPRSSAGGLIDHRLTPKILEGAVSGLVLFGPLAVAFAILVRSRIGLVVALAVLTAVQYVLWNSQNHNLASDGAMVMFLGWLLAIPFAAAGMAIQIVRVMRGVSDRLSSEA